MLSWSKFTHLAVDLAPQPVVGDHGAGERKVSPLRRGEPAGLVVQAGALHHGAEGVAGEEVGRAEDHRGSGAVGDDVGAAVSGVVQVHAVAADETRPAPTPRARGAALRPGA